MNSAYKHNSGGWKVLFVSVQQVWEAVHKNDCILIIKYIVIASSSNHILSILIVAYNINLVLSSQVLSGETTFPSDHI